MSRWVAVVATIVVLSGCGGRGVSPSDRPPAGPSQPPPAAACDASVLPAQLGNPQPDFSACSVQALVTALGEDVRRAKIRCGSFIALDGDWKQRMANWDRLLVTVMAKAQPAGGQPDPIATAAKVVRDTATPMASSATLRDLSLNNLLTSVSSLEAKAGVPSHPNPDCQP